MIDPKLQGKVAIVTGSNNPHGTGSAIALELAKQGVKICAQYYSANNDVSEPDKMGEEFYYAQQNKSADWLIDQIKKEGGEAVAVEADLSQSETIKLIFDKAEELGPVEILVNNAAYSVPDTFTSESKNKTGGGFSSESISIESHDKHFAVNSRAVALAMAEFTKRHRKRNGTWGRIVNISSDGAPAFATEVSYGASKYALESFSRSAAQELGQLGITVNVASLGPIQTGWLSPEFEKNIAKGIPLRRIGTPKDVADAVLLLVSEQSRWLTGQVIYVGGGHRMI